MPPNCEWEFCAGLVFVCITLCSTNFSNHLDEKEIADCLAIIVFWMSCFCNCSVAPPQVAMGWSAIVIVV